MTVHLPVLSPSGAVQPPPPPPAKIRGGSTITQQVAKLLCLGVVYDQAKWKSEADYEEDCRSGGVMRKLKELPFAVAMEVKYSKEEILTIYFNRAYLGAGARGFEAAAQRYFGISAHDVSPAQAAMLAGLLKAPSKYAPTSNLQRAQDRANIIVGLMEEQGYLTKAEADEARAHPAQLFIQLRRLDTIIRREQHDAAGQSPQMRQGRRWCCAGSARRPRG